MLGVPSIITQNKRYKLDLPWLARIVICYLYETYLDLTGRKWQWEDWNPGRIATKHIPLIRNRRGGN